MNRDASESNAMFRRSSRSELLFLELMRERALEDYYYGVGPKPKGEGGPEPYLVEGLSVQGLLSSILFPDPEGSDPEGHGPGGPVMRDILTNIGIARLASTLNNQELGRQLRSVALEQIVSQAQELQNQG